MSSCLTPLSLFIPRHFKKFGVYPPFKKLRLGVRPFVCLSVCLSVRPSVSASFSLSGGKFLTNFLRVDIGKECPGHADV